MTPPADAGFDRLRRRGIGTSDPQGRQALYSAAEQSPAPGAVTVACSSCGVLSTVTPRRLLALAVPSLHLPVLRRTFPSWMQCPACARRTWVRLGLSL